jgi:hypothetical protein
MGRLCDENGFPCEDDFSMPEYIHDACIVDAKAGEPPRKSLIEQLVADGRIVDDGDANICAGKPRLPTDSAKRKGIPVFSGVIRYFPDALAEVARLSLAGNEKHNPGEPLHWSRGKSTDHLDCIARHMHEAGTTDSDGILHDAKIAWRALANLQVLLERVRGLPISPGSKK